MVKPTAEQIQEIRSLSFEAQSFLQSNLYKKLQATLDRTRQDITDRLFNNKREKNEENLSREQFVERLSAQYQTLYASLVVIQNIAGQGKELDRILAEDKTEVKDDVGSKKGRNPSHGQ